MGPQLIKEIGFHLCDNNMDFSRNTFGFNSKSFRQLQAFIQYHNNNLIESCFAFIFYQHHSRENKIHLKVLYNLLTQLCVRFQYVVTDDVQHISALSNLICRKTIVKLSMTGERKREKADNYYRFLDACVYRKTKKSREVKSRLSH